MNKDFYPICTKCGKRQKKQEAKSNENWSVYPNVPCECGGEFEIRLMPTKAD